MKLIKQIGNLPHFSIYELNNNEVDVCGGKYLLWYGKEISEFALNEGIDSIMKYVKRTYFHPAIFQTEKEARYFAMYINMKRRYENIDYHIKEIIKMNDDIPDFDID